jgi:acetyltransferase-like isoleucine patch superfamily enzyme
MVHRPRGVAIGTGSYVRRPFIVEGATHIHIGRDCNIREGAHIIARESWQGETFAPEIYIGDGVYIGPRVFLTAIKGITIEAGCVFAEGVYITDLFHCMDPYGGPIMEQPLESKGPVHIGRNSFLGFRSCIMPGVSLGPHCIVGANAVVTKSFEGYVMLGGVPAKVVKTYSHDLRQWIEPNHYCKTF